MRPVFLTLSLWGSLAFSCPQKVQVCAPDFPCYPLEAEHPELEHFQAFCKSQRERCLYGVRLLPDGRVFVFCGDRLTPVQTK